MPVKVGFLQFRLPDVILALSPEARHRTGHRPVEVQIQMEMNIADAPLVLRIVVTRRKILRARPGFKSTPGPMDVETREKKASGVNSFASEPTHLSDMIFKSFPTVRLRRAHLLSRHRVSQDGG